MIPFWTKVKNKLNYYFNKIRGKKIIHFIHIGKTGGSAVKNALNNHMNGPKYIIYPYSHDFTLRNVPYGDKTIFFLRDPIARFVSGFYSRKRQGLPRQLNPWSSDEKIVFEKYDTPNPLALALSSNDSDEREFAQFAMRSIGHVRSSYWDWFENEKYLYERAKDIFLIGFQESLSEDFETLKAKLNLPVNLELPNDDVKSHKTPDSMNKNLDQDAIKNLKEWYKEDYKFIEVCKTMIQNKIVNQ